MDHSTAELFFILAQILGIFNTILCIISVQFKKASSILLAGIGINLLSAASFLLLGGTSGGWICIAATVQTVIMYLIDHYSKKNTEIKRKILLVLFLAVYLVGTVITYQSWHDLFSFACAVWFVLSIVQKEAKNMRNFTLLNAFCWLVYDVATMAYTNVFTRLSLIVSIIVAKVRLDRKPKAVKP